MKKKIYRRLACCGGIKPSWVPSVYCSKAQLKFQIGAWKCEKQTVTTWLCVDSDRPRGRERTHNLFVLLFTTALPLIKFLSARHLVVVFTLLSIYQLKNIWRLLPEKGIGLSGTWRWAMPAFVYPAHMWWIRWSKSTHVGHLMAEEIIQPLPKCQNW